MNIINLLNNYSREHHTNELYSNFERINFSVTPILSQNWSDPAWIITNEIPYVALTNLLDSYDCLPERPDMAFTHLWKSINNTYIKIGKKDRVANHSNARLSDKDGIDFLIDKIFDARNQVIENNITLISLLDSYLAIIPEKTLKFIANIILKGDAIENAGISSLLNSSSYFSIKSNHTAIFNNIVSTYGISYRAITNPRVSGIKVDLGITNKQKSKAIPDSLSQKLRELLQTRNTIVSNSTRNLSVTLTLDDKQLIDFVIRIILYSIRNNSVHGNLVARLNSEFANIESLKASIYIYYLAHLILSYGMFVNDEVDINELTMNIENLSRLTEAIA